MGKTGEKILSEPLPVILDEIVDTIEQAKAASADARAAAEEARVAGQEAGLAAEKTAQTAIGAVSTQVAEVRAQVSVLRMQMDEAIANIADLQERLENAKSAIKAVGLTNKLIMYAIADAVHAYNERMKAGK